jgi:thiol-disulfide isomerase/thioredoxin
MICFVNNIFIRSAVLAVILFTGIAAQADSGAKVERIDEATLNKLITADDSYLVLSFMAAWCGPCIDELPALNRLHKKYKDRNVQIIGISIDFDGPGAMQPIIKKLNIDFPVYWCGEKAISKFNLNAIPMLLFIRRGEMVERLHGKRPEKFLDQKIQEFLKK